MNDTPLKKQQNLFLYFNKVKMLTAPPSILLDFNYMIFCILISHIVGFWLGLAGLQ